MKVLVVGGGGREHALAWKMAQSPKVQAVYVAPGNGGTALDSRLENIAITDVQALRGWAQSEKIALTVVGPEQPLAAGIVDEFRAHGLRVFGPTRAAAQLESSKAFSKAFMKRHGIPTAAYQAFTAENLAAGYAFLDTLKAPYVLKADGLAAGKGVLILEDLATAKKELKSMLLDAKFGAASTTVVIEAFLEGIELSCFVLTDGKNYKVLPTAKDYKRIGAGDTGLNTGGMGAISPVPFADAAFMDKIHKRVVEPTVKGLEKDGLPYKGFIFIGLIKVGEDPFVIEYNVRLGDPETEVVLPRLKIDLVAVFNAVANQTLDQIQLEIDPRTATTVMSVAGGYPEVYEKGHEISGLETPSDSLVFHAGTTIQNGSVVTNGGRVLAVTSFGDNHKEALSKSYQRLKGISFKDIYYREDLGFDLD